jgi:hypothetical protein
LNNRIVIAFLLIFSAQCTVVFGYAQWTGQTKLVSSDGSVLAVLYDTGSGINTSKALSYLENGARMVFYGNTTFPVSKVYQPQLVIANSTGSKLVACGLWLQRDGNRTIEHQLLVYDISFTGQDMDSINSWVNDSEELSTPDGYIILGSITQIDHHEPYGMLETRTDVLKVLDDNQQYDWYDVSVTQRLTPSINYTSSKWVWNWLTYTMNGSLGASNVYLSEYDQPPSGKLPEGPFGFLWKILGFDVRTLFPWLYPSVSNVEGLDMSDYSLELFRVRYQALRTYSHRNEPLEIRHHYVLRTENDVAPCFWQQSQAQYTQVNDIAQIPYITPPLTSGYINMR